MRVIDVKVMMLHFSNISNIEVVGPFQHASITPHTLLLTIKLVHQSRRDGQ